MTPIQGFSWALKFCPFQATDQGLSQDLVLVPCSFTTLNPRLTMLQEGIFMSYKLEQGLNACFLNVAVK